MYAVFERTIDVESKPQSKINVLFYVQDRFTFAPFLPIRWQIRSQFAQGEKQSAGDEHPSAGGANQQSHTRVLISTLRLLFPTFDFDLQLTVRTSWESHISWMIPDHVASCVITCGYWSLLPLHECLRVVVDHCEVPSSRSFHFLVVLWLCRRDQ